MENFNLLVYVSNESNYAIKTKHVVRLTHINNPSEFYVRPIKHWELINQLESTQPLIKPSVLNLHDVVMFNQNNSEVAVYARGKILAIETTGNVKKYNLFALDYGFCKVITEEYIWECNQNYASLPPLAISCQLAHCAALGGKEWSLESIDAFKCYIDDERANMLILDKTMDQLIVELRNSNPDDIATLMALTGYSTLGNVHNAINRFSVVKSEKNILHIKN